MKYIAIGFAVWFAIAWLPQFIKAWLFNIRFNRAKKHAGEDDEWIYEI